MKKIALLTLPLGHNYGGIIQNYALQKVLMNRGYIVETIDRRPDNPHSKLKILGSKYKSYFFRYILKSNNPSYLGYDEIFKHNLNFMRDHINLSKPMDSTTDLVDHFKNHNYSAIVVGSDQVWRPKYTPNIYNFYLDFLQGKSSMKKLTYAASFGTDSWEYDKEETIQCAKLVQEFDAVSVREASGLKLLMNYLEKEEGLHVLDPTLLLEKVDYSRLIKNNLKKKGLFTYVLDTSAGKKEFISKCSKKLNLETFHNQAKNDSELSKLTDYIMPPLEGWLQGFRDADYVITDSFHGTIFSIINEKPFLSLVNVERGASRFESLLRLLGLENRLVYNVDNFDSSKLNEKIDYKEVQSKLNRLKSKSFDFLENNL